MCCCIIVKQKKKLISNSKLLRVKKKVTHTTMHKKTHRELSTNPIFRPRYSWDKKKGRRRRRQEGSLGAWSKFMAAHRVPLPSSSSCWSPACDIRPHWKWERGEGVGREGDRMEQIDLVRVLAMPDPLKGGCLLWWCYMILHRWNWRLIADAHVSVSVVALRWCQRSGRASASNCDAPVALLSGNAYSHSGIIGTCREME